MIKNMRNAAIIMFFAMASGVIGSTVPTMIPDRRFSLKSIALVSGTSTWASAGDTLKYINLEIYDGSSAITSTANDFTVSIKKPLQTVAASGGNLISKASGGKTKITFSDFNLDFFAPTTLCYFFI